MRLFVAVRPPDDVLDALSTLPRSQSTTARWTTRDQWHITLRFFGNVDDPAPIIDALDSVARRFTPIDVHRGERAGVLGHRVVYLPVAGLTELADAVVDATREFGDPPSARKFRGHLTLARTKGDVVDTSALRLERAWTAHEVELIRSTLGRGGARYDTLRAFSLSG